MFGGGGVGGKVEPLVADGLGLVGVGDDGGDDIRCVELCVGEEVATTVEDGGPEDPEKIRALLFKCNTVVS